MNKILFLECAQNNGGARKAVLQMAKSLAHQYDVSILDLYGSCKPFVDSCKASGLQFSVFSEENPHFIRSAKSIKEKIGNIISFLPHIIRLGKQLNKYIDDNGYHYVCVSTFRPLLSFIFHRPQAKLVFFAHGWYIKSQISLFNRFLLKKRADRIVGISQATKQALFNNGIAPLSQLYVVHNAISINNDEIIPAKIDGAESCLTILHCGGFSSGKGQLFSLDLAKELKRRGVCFKMVFAGIVYRGNSSERYLIKIKERVELLGLSQDIVFVVNHDNVYEYIKACDVLIHPSDTEGLPLVVMEAQFFKKPVVANGVGGVIDLISDRFTGFLPSHNSVAEYADILCEICANPHHYDELVERAYQQIIKCYSKEEQLRQLENVFC